MFIAGILITNGRRIKQFYFCYLIVVHIRVSFGISIFSNCCLYPKNFPINIHRTIKTMQ